MPIENNDFPALHRRYDYLSVEINKLSGIVQEAAYKHESVTGYAALMGNYQLEQDELRRIFNYFEHYGSDKPKIPIHPTALAVAAALWFAVTLAILWFVR